MLSPDPQLGEDEAQIKRDKDEMSGDFAGRKLDDVQGKTTKQDSSLSASYACDPSCDTTFKDVERQSDEDMFASDNEADDEKISATALAFLQDLEDAKDDDFDPDYKPPKKAGKIWLCFD